jgi:hypothetical protein
VRVSWCFEESRRIRRMGFGCRGWWLHRGAGGRWGGLYLVLVDLVGFSKLEITRGPWRDWEI